MSAYRDMLSFPKRISYGIGRLGSSFLLGFVDYAGFAIYYVIFQLNPALTGLAVAIGYVVIGFTHWLTGFFSDKTKTRLGRRKPYVIVGAPGLAIAAFMIFIPQVFIPASPNPRADLPYQTVMFTYYVVFVSLFKFFYAFLLTAFQAWLPEISEPEERSTISAMQNTASQIGTAGGVVLGFVSALLFAGGALTSLGFIALAAACLLEFLLFLPSIAFIRERADIVIPKRSLFGETATILRNRNYVGWFMAIGFWSITLSAVTNAMVQLVQYGLRLPTIQLIIAALGLFMSIFVWLYVWGFIGKRLGHKRTLQIGLLLLAAVLPFTVVLPPSFPLVILFALPIGAAIACMYVMRYVGTADIARADELVTGESRAGIYEGFYGVPLNIFQAIGVQLLGVILLFGEVYPPMSYPNYGIFWWGPIFAPYLVISAIILSWITIDFDFKALEKRKKT
jgi:GPH family glycoside/pentoside/hexuronide:cation symporter